MLTSDLSAYYALWKSTNSIVQPKFVLILLLSLTGCADERAGGPVTSNVSAPTSATGPLESDEASHSTAADVGGEDPVITMTSTPSGVTANLSSDQPPGFNVTGYTIYYGKSLQDPQSVQTTSEELNPEELQTEELNWCSQGESKTVEAPSTTITGLQPNTAYFFAIRAFTKNESESLCSNEIVVITPAAEA